MQSQPNAGDLYIEARTWAIRWRLREIRREAYVLERLAEPDRSRYLYLKDLLRTSRSANERDLREQ